MPVDSSRGMMQLALEILEASYEEKAAADLLLLTKLSPRTLRLYLKFLKERGLLSITKNGGCKITRQGLRFIDEYDQLLGALRPRDLEA